jgi:hypothetical protein
VWIGLDLLAAEHGGRSKVLVDGRQKLDVAFGQERFCAPEFEVVGPPCCTPPLAP